MTFLEMEICVRNFREQMTKWGFGNLEQVKVAVLKFLKYQREVVANESSSESSSERFPERHKAFLLSCSYEFPKMLEVEKGVQLDHYERVKFREDMIVLMKEYLFSDAGAEVEFNQLPYELRKKRREQQGSTKATAVKPGDSLDQNKEELELGEQEEVLFLSSSLRAGASSLNVEVISVSSDSEDLENPSDLDYVCNQSSDSD